MKEKYRVLIWTCWTVYVVCLMIKLCGGNRFEIACNNERFIEICTYVDSNIYIKMSISMVAYTLSNYLIYLCLVKKKIFQDLWYLLLLIICSVVNMKFNNIYLNIGMSVFYLIVVPLFRTKFKGFLNIIFGVILVCLFQQISLWTRNIGWELPNDNTLIMLITQIDYYIMIIIYFLFTHSKKEKEVK